jgi:hypothetical protein
VLILNAKINNLSSNNHNKDEMFKDIHEMILSSRIINRQTNLSLVFKLFHIVVVVANIPAQWVTQS